MKGCSPCAAAVSCSSKHPVQCSREHLTARSCTASCNSPAHTEKGVWRAPAAISHRTMPMEKISAFVVMVCDKPHQAQSQLQHSSSAQYAVRVTARHGGMHQRPVNCHFPNEFTSGALAECHGDRLKCCSAPLQAAATTALHRVTASLPHSTPCLTLSVVCAQGALARAWGLR